MLLIVLIPPSEMSKVSQISTKSHTDYLRNLINAFIKFVMSRSPW